MPEKQPITNPHDDAMKAIVSRHLDVVDGESGKSRREIMDEQGVTIASETLESDDLEQESLIVDGEIEVDIDSDDFNPQTTTQEEQDEEDVTVFDGDAEAQAAADEEAELAELTGEEPEAPFYEKDGQYYTKIKVDGEERELTFEELRASAQKDRASYKRFEDATRKLQEVEAREAALEKERVKMATQQPAEPKRPAVAVEDVEATVEELYDAYSFDSEEDVKEKLRKLLSGGAHLNADESGRGDTSTPVDLDAVRNEVRATIEEDRAKELETQRLAAVAQWEIDYSDVAESEELRNIANIKSAQLYSDDPSRHPADILDEAGKFARRWKAAQGEIPTGDVEERQARKKSIPAPVRSSGRAAQRQKVPEARQTRADVVAEMARQRGQAIN